MEVPKLEDLRAMCKPPTPADCECDVCSVLKCIFASIVNEIADGKSIEPDGIIEQIDEYSGSTCGTSKLLVIQIKKMILTPAAAKALPPPTSKALPPPTSKALPPPASVPDDDCIREVFDELEAENNRLKAENNRLKAENNELRALLARTAVLLPKRD
jgi:hypothetical protein